MLSSSLLKFSVIYEPKLFDLDNFVSVLCLILKIALFNQLWGKMKGPGFGEQQLCMEEA